MPRQRVIDSVQAVADSGGNVVLRFNGPPAGSAWSGTASVPKAELGSNWFATFNDPNAIPLGAWLGRSFFGPVYVDSSERLVIVGTGLTPGQTYTGTFLGVSDWADALPFVSPDPNITSLSLDQLVAATVQAGLFIGGDYQGTWYSHAVSYFATAAALTAEASSRSSDDTTLQGNINNEATTRATADNTLQTNITNEANSRSSADTTLQGNINNEATTRANADSSEATARANADTNLQNQINAFGAPSWQAPTFQNSWSNYSAFDPDWQNVRYCKDALGFVHIEGIMAAGSVTMPVVLFNLPAGYRPLKDHGYVVNGSPNAIGGTFAACRVDVLLSGDVLLRSADQAINNVFLMVDGISFGTT